jgi:hypothetical protein
MGLITNLAGPPTHCQPKIKQNIPFLGHKMMKLLSWTRSRWHSPSLPRSKNFHSIRAQFFSSSPKPTSSPPSPAPSGSTLLHRPPRSGASRHADPARPQALAAPPPPRGRRAASAVAATVRLYLFPRIYRGRGVCCAAVPARAKCLH